MNCKYYKVDNKNSQKIFRESQDLIKENEYWISKDIVNESGIWG